jgi:hypothetical protein
MNLINATTLNRKSEYARVGMTILFRCQDLGLKTNLSSRPERSEVEGPAVLPRLSGSIVLNPWPRPPGFTSSSYLWLAQLGRPLDCQNRIL